MRFLGADLSYQEIAKLVRAKFSRDIPGLKWDVVPANKGESFELESALYVEYLGEQVLGLNLDINVFYVPLADLSKFDKADIRL